MFNFILIFNWINTLFAYFCIWIEFALPDILKKKRYAHLVT